MLQSLYLRDFVIVDHADIEFEAGFCALSGETGAGKSILLDALGLALGGRSDAASVRSGARRTEISARFAPSDSVQHWLSDHELANEDDQELLLRRVVDRDGRSRSFINGSPVKLAQLRELGAQLLEIHGQHASQSLLRHDGQRALLDSFASLGDAVADVTVAWRTWQAGAATLAQATSDSQQMQTEHERLGWQLAQIENLQLGDGEWEQLSTEQQRLANAADLIGGVNETVQALTESDGAVTDTLAQLIGQLQACARIDPKLEASVDLLDSARIQMAEAASDMSAYLDLIELDPARLELVEQRVSAIFAVARQLNIEPDQLHEHGQALASRISELQRAQDVEKLQQEVERLEADYRDQAGRLSALRQRAAGAMAAGVSKHLASLGMPAARFDVHCTASGAGPHGMDQIEFQFSGHASMAPRALARVASGGELSRISLAIAVNAAQANPVQSLIFDEADAGVGGSVADAIGLLMRSLGDARQVLAVTHLPQVAARAHHHYRVTKTTRKGQVSSQVELLTDAARTDEIARMLGGARVTATTRKHASELLDMGRQAMATPTGTGGRKKKSTTAQSPGAKVTGKTRKATRARSTRSS